MQSNTWREGVKRDPCRGVRRHPLVNGWGRFSLKFTFRQLPLFSFVEKRVYRLNIKTGQGIFY